MKKNLLNVIRMDTYKRNRDSIKSNSVIARKTIKTLRKRSRHNTVVLGLLEHDWPVAISIIETICEYIGHKICCNDEPVIYPILEFALERYSRFLFHRGSEKHEDAVRLAAFIEGLITMTCHKTQEAQAGFKSDSKSSALSVINKRTLSDWLDAELDVETRLVLRRFLYELVANKHVKYILKSANYENAVVLGSLGARN